MMGQWSQLKFYYTVQAKCIASLKPYFFNSKNQIEPKKISTV